MRAASIFVVSSDEIALRSRLRSICPYPGLSNVEIDLHNPFLAPDFFDQERKIGFQSFAKITTALPEKDVFRDLL